MSRKIPQIDDAWKRASNSTYVGKPDGEKMEAQNLTRKKMVTCPACDKSWPVLKLTRFCYCSCGKEFVVEDTRRNKSSVPDGGQ